MLSDATRVCLLWALLDGELPVNSLASAVDKPPAAVSQHLAKLRIARLVCTRRQGTQVFYRIENSHVHQLVQDAVYHAEHAHEGNAPSAPTPSARHASRSAASRAAGRA